VFDDFEESFDKWCNFIPPNPPKRSESHSASSQKPTATQEYTETPMDPSPPAAGSRETPSDTEYLKRDAGHGAATKAKTIQTARPPEQPSAREQNRKRNEANKKAKAAAAAKTNIDTNKLSARNAANEAAESAGLKLRTMCTKEYWQQELDNMSERRSDLVQVLTTCVERLENHVILQDHVLKREVDRFEETLASLSIIQRDTNSLVSRGSQIDDVLSILTSFTDKFLIQDVMFTSLIAKFNACEEEQLQAIRAKS